VTEEASDVSLALSETRCPGSGLGICVWAAANGHGWLL